MEPVYPDGIALKRLPVTSCHPDSQSCPCFHFFPKPRSSGLSQSNPHIRFKLAKPGFYCTQLRILPDIKRDSELGLELLGSVDTRIVHLPGCIHIQTALLFPKGRSGHVSQIGLLLCIKVKRQRKKQCVHAKIQALQKHSKFLIGTQWSNICNIKNIQSQHTHKIRAVFCKFQRTSCLLSC